MANLGNLRPFIGKHWQKAVLGVSLIIFTSLLGLPQPLITRHIVDRVILSRRLDLLGGAIIALVAIVLAEKLATGFQRFHFSRLEQEVTLDIEKDLLHRTLRFPKSFFDAHQTGYLMSRFSSDVQGLRWFFSSSVVHIGTNMVRFVGGMVLLVYLEWRLAFTVLVLLPGVTLLVHYFSTRMHSLSHESMEQQAQVSGHFQESISSIPLIKAFSSEDRTVQQLISRLKAAFQVALEQSVVSSVANLAITSVPGIARVIVLASGAYWVVKGQWTLGSLLAFQAYLGYVFGPVQLLANANLQLQDARAALERISALLDVLPEENMGTGKTVKRLAGEIEFRNVSFAYNGGDPILQDISFTIRSGEHVAIVGNSGVGKTTVASLILLFYRPTSGTVYFDGRPASDYEVGSLRQRIGYVTQGPLLLSGSIMENLRYGNPEATEEEILRAAKIAGISEFIASLPGAFETVIGERGVTLSEGQRQRLALARALVKDPDILVLDEPTASVDSLTERSIFQSLPSLAQEKTLVVTTHRLSTIMDSDRILLLEKGRLADVGTHQSLLERSDHYRSLVACQQIQTEHDMAQDLALSESVPP
jgi:ABC-type multidrug transport system fused ATPase/permease subunit